MSKVNLIDPRGVAKDKIFVLRFESGERGKEFGTFYYCDADKIDKICGIRGDFAIDSSGSAELEEVIPLIRLCEAGMGFETVDLQEIIKN